MSPGELDRYRDKWREAPRGSEIDGRVFSSELLALPDEEFLSAWTAMAARRYGGELGWLGELYGDTFAQRRVLELGSGLGFDGIRFVERGAHWTFADIVPDNLSVIRRVARLRGLGDRVRIHLIADDLSFSGLPVYDTIWVFGSIHHVPFEMARREALNAFEHLRPGGRWMELVYPRERWLREGALPFDQWGKLTDGERTPWAEWHDVEKVRRRLFPAPLRTLLDFEFCAGNFAWFDLHYVGSAPFRLAEHDLAALSRTVDLLAGPVMHEGGRRPPWRRGAWFACPPSLFGRAASIDLAQSVDRLGPAAGVAVDLELSVTRGLVGVGLVDRTGIYLPSEAAAKAGPWTRLVTLPAVGQERPAKLIFRNLQEGAASTFAIRSAILRVAT